MNKIKSATIKVNFEYNYTEMINTMIEDNRFDLKDEVKNFLRDCIIEDLLNDLNNNPNLKNNPNCRNITIKIT